NVMLVRQWYLTVKHSKQRLKFKVNSHVSLVVADSSVMFTLSSHLTNKAQALSSKTTSSAGRYHVNSFLRLKPESEIHWKPVYLRATQWYTIKQDYLTVHTTMSTHLRWPSKLLHHLH